MNENMKAYFAEFLATFILVFAGPGTVLANFATNGGVGIVGIAFAHGLAIAAGVYLFSHISGAHINPAVTFAMWLLKKIQSVKAAGYVVAQLLGAMAAAWFLKLIFNKFVPAAHLGTTNLAQPIPVWHGVLIEAFLTFFLVLTVLGFSNAWAKKEFAGLIIGLVVVMDIFIGGFLTGASMNPARTFGPALLSGFWQNHFVYWVGPLLGALVAALVWQYVFWREAKAAA